MLSREMLQEELQKYDFDQLARREPNGRRRIRLLALAHLKAGRNCVEVAQALRTTRHAVMRWMQWFAAGGMARPHTWSTQKLPKTQEEAFRQAVEQLQTSVVAAGCAQKISGSCWTSSSTFTTAAIACIACSSA